MKQEICKSYSVELMERARLAIAPDGAFERHLTSCKPCQERWEAQTQVTAGLRSIRFAATDRASSAERRDRLMRQFDQQYPAAPIVIRRQPSRVRAWAWGLAAAAALLIAAGTLVPLRSHFRGHLPAAIAGAVSTVQPVAFNGAFESSDARNLTADDFVAVPYAPPLASGEMIRIVQADLDPQALATLGFDPDPAWTGNLSAEVVVGQDGYPRAVRISDNTQF